MKIGFRAACCSFSSRGREIDFVETFAADKDVVGRPNG